MPFCPNPCTRLIRALSLLWWPQQAAAGARASCGKLEELLAKCCGLDFGTPVESVAVARASGGPLLSYGPKLFTLTYTTGAAIRPGYCAGR